MESGHPYRFPAGQTGCILVASSADGGLFVRTDGMVPQSDSEAPRTETGEVESPVFRIKGLIEPHIYIHLAVAESLLRRFFTGIRVQRVEMEAGRRIE